MADIGTIANYAEIISGVLVVGGLAFAAYELNQTRKQKHRDASFELMHSMQTPELLAGIMLVRRLPDGLGKEELEKVAGDEMQRVWQLMGQFESLGILVFRREVPIELAEEFWASSITTCWPKLKSYVQEVRNSTGREEFMTGYQWMAEMMDSRTQHHIPIHLDYKGRFA